MVKDFNKDGAFWIGHPISSNYVMANQYLEFSRTFSLKEVFNNETLEISSDSDYAVWINGEFVNFGQYPDFPHYKVYDKLLISKYLVKGENQLCIQVYCQGEDSNNYYGGACGLLYSLTSKEKRIVSDDNTLVRKSNTYYNGPTYRNQIGFTFEYDASFEDKWIKEGLKPYEEVIKAIVLKDYPSGYKLNLRPIDKLGLGERISGKVIAQGTLLRRDRDISPSESMFKDYLSSRRFHEIIQGEQILSGSINNKQWNSINMNQVKDSDGFYMVIDLGQEEAGLIEFNIDTNKGVILDFAVGEHLEDLRVRSKIGSRNFANRYICKLGRQHFTHYFSRYGGRYLQIHVSGTPFEYFNFSYIGLRRTEYPIKYIGRFKSSDNLHNKIYDVAIHTLKLCMHEHYEDTPWREQALYALDSSNQALCGYYTFGDYDFSKASLRLLAKSLRDDGYLDLCPPGKAPITIPIFTLAFIKALYDYVLYSGDIAFAHENIEVIKIIINTYIETLNNGVLVTPADVKYWNFYEWAHELDGEPIIRERPLEYRLDAPLNFFFIIALDAAINLLNICDDSTCVEDYQNLVKLVRKKSHEVFFDQEKLLYRNYIGDKEYLSYSELTQSLALYVDIVPSKHKEFLLELLSNEKNGLTKVTLSQSLFKYEVLLSANKKYQDVAIKQIGKDWGYMLYNNATTFWETLKGASDFEDAGSLCHGWSAIPTYLYHAYILGIKPLEPGFKKVKINPVSGGFYTAEGKIRTPFGEIEVAWKKENEKIIVDVDVPDEVEVWD